MSAASYKSRFCLPKERWFRSMLGQHVTKSYLTSTENLTGTRLRLRKNRNKINPARMRIPSQFYCCHLSLKQYSLRSCPLPPYYPFMSLTGREPKKQRSKKKKITPDLRLQTVVFQLFDFHLRKFKKFIIKKSSTSTITCQHWRQI